MNKVYLERREPEDNTHRFYEIEATLDLFDVWCVTRSWGRIGTHGQSLIRSFDCTRTVESEIIALQRIKLQRGYQA
jgi:predicted DNA-binding WGR domain protein